MLVLVLSLASAGAPLADSPLADCSVVARTTVGDSAILADGACAWERGDAENAVTILPRVQDEDLLPWARLYQARAHLDLSQPQQALDALEAVSATGRAGLDIRLVRGEALVVLGRSLDARPDLRNLLDTEVGDAARYWLAKGGEDRGAKQAAIATYRVVWTDSVRGEWSTLAEEALKRLGAAVPDVSTRAGVALIQQRAKALADDKQPLRARDLLELVAQAPAAETGTGLPLARARAAARDYPGAIAIYEEVLGDDDNATGSAQDLFDYALAVARTGDYDTSAELYARVMDQHPATPQAVTASFKRGYMAYDERDCDSAGPLLDEHLTDHPASPHADEALWFASRCAFLTSDLDRATVLLDRLLAQHQTSDLVAGATYWRARADGMRGNAEAETIGLEAVLMSYPVSGYAWFAAERLGKTFTGQTPASLEPLDPAVAQQPLLRTARKLLDAGLDDDAAERLMDVGAGSDRRTRLAVASMLLDAGRIRQARDLASVGCARQGFLNDHDTLALCLPRPERRFVEPAAAWGHQDPSLSYAIMTAESALNPTVASAAGARGLMQVMPAEGTRMHAQTFGSRGGFDVDRLYDPSYNAALGATELASNADSLGDTLNGPDIPAVIASYNAGQVAVLRWLDDADDNPEFDAWSEEIGYSETRRYVRRVLGFWMAYRWAYGDPELDSDLADDRVERP